MKNKIIYKFIETVMYVSSYMSGGLSLFIGNRCKNDKIKKFFMGAHALKSFRSCVKQFSKNHIHFLLFEAPDVNKIMGLSKEEIEVLNMKLTSRQLLNNDEYLKKANEHNKRCYEFAKTRYKGTKLIHNGVFIQSADYEGEYYNVKGGIRKTFYQPEKYKYCIHMYGSCIVRGFGVSDEYTIPSYVQDKLNDSYPEIVKVLNYGTGGKAGVEGLINDLKYIQNTQFNKGDIVILVTYNTFHSNQFKRILKNNYYECSSLFHAPHSFGWWFLNSTIHLNAVGNEVISDYIVKSLTTTMMELAKSTEIEEKNNGLTIGKSNYYGLNQQLKQYMKDIKKYRLNGNKKIGCIVMNCNPFTYGHKHLIKEALKEVDALYIFVVEENKSFFSFDDRLTMVKEGTKEYSNVIVLPSGQFMISSLTFPEYFDKEDNQDIKIDATNDLKIFGEKISPVLRITTRFAGEEPTDLITRQYNDAMSTELKKYGIKFICIPRLKHKENFISASIVRKKMKLYEIDDLQNLIPPTTYTIVKKYMSKSI